MGRKTKVPESYTGAVTTTSRLRDAIRSDPSILDTRRALALQACASLITQLLNIENEKDLHGHRETTEGTASA